MVLGLRGKGAEDHLNYKETGNMFESKKKQFLRTSHLFMQYHIG